MEKKQRHEMEAGVRDFWGLQREYGSRIKGCCRKISEAPRCVNQEACPALALCPPLKKIPPKRYDRVIIPKLLYWGCLGFRVLGYYPPIMENQMEKNMDNEMETGIISYAVRRQVRGSFVSFLLWDCIRGTFEGLPCICICLYATDFTHT